MELLEDPDDVPEQETDNDQVDEECAHLTAEAWIKGFIHTLSPGSHDLHAVYDSFTSCCKFTEQQTNFIEGATDGQNLNKNWHKMQARLVTASDLELCLE